MTITPTASTVGLDELPAPADLLARVREARRVADAAETAVLVSAAEWADLHPLGSPDVGGALDDERLPDLQWDAPAEFAAACGMSTSAGQRLIHHALELRHRLPRVWARILAGEVAVWRARRIAEATMGHPSDVAAHVDAMVESVAHRVGPVVLDRLLDEAMLRLYPEQRELDQLEALDSRFATLHEASINHTGVVEMTLRGDFKDLSDFDDTLAEVAAALAVTLEAQGMVESLDVRRSMAVGVLADPAQALELLNRPAPPKGTPGHVPERRARRKRVTLVVHLTDAALAGSNAVGRCDASRGGVRPVLEQQIRDWCGRVDTELRVQPVIDLNDHTQVAAYEVPDRLRARVELFHHQCMFPWCTRPARASDCDHVIPHGKGGATCDCNLAPLCRRHHRLKTHTRWTYVVVEPGVFLWTTPHGYQLLRNHTGTHDVSPAVSRARDPEPDDTGCLYTLTDPSAVRALRSPPVLARAR
ncbi:putative HNH endonuclease [metagenome]|uniref:Putative HNH endonuclease n=1 Tax=metagenome TaxID=256318 RepID=A0A2P2CC61_9ZZZZ